MHATSPPQFEKTSAGLYCPAGDFYVDPVRGVHRAIITHAHADHARRGSRVIIAARKSARLLQLRIGRSPDYQFLEYGESVKMNKVKVSLHPSGHILGSAQIRIESVGGVTVFSGDFKLDHDPTCERFETVQCDHFISECTFGESCFVWPSIKDVIDEISVWRTENRSKGKASVLIAYALGKAQRLLTYLSQPETPVICDSEIATINHVYRHEGIDLPDWNTLSEVAETAKRLDSLFLISPRSMADHFRPGVPTEAAFVSGWMLQPNRHRRPGVSHGFVISDHADWPALNQAVRDSGAGHITLTHGDPEILQRHLQNRGFRVSATQTTHPE